MLTRKELIESMDKKYELMLSQVNIPDFTKCIAQFSGLDIQEVKDEVIKSYLQTWAENKYRFFELLGNKTQLDEKITYKNTNDNMELKLRELEIKYPGYALWLDGFKYIETNKISLRDVTIEVEKMVNRLFPNYKLGGSTMTHFFKSMLNASDELVTDIGRMFENNEIEATHTVSIDPVDMMLASENPYGWTSCYRLECGNDCLHGDGCLAAILDNTSLITYVWNNEGKFSLYDNYTFKNVRYKRMRRWIAISETMNSIHFNMVYPDKFNIKPDFDKQLRIIVENTINRDAVWVREPMYIDRINYYGYNEYSREDVWHIKDTSKDVMSVFDEEILCPCGCGNALPGSSEDDEIYNGEGFVCCNFEERHYCSIIDDYCDNGEDCAYCSAYNRENAVCTLDTNEYCDANAEAEDNGNFDPYESNIVHCGDHCEGCPLYKLHHPEEFENEEEAREVVVLGVDYSS